MGSVLCVIARSECGERRSNLVFGFEITAKAVIKPRNRKTIARNDNVAGRIGNDSLRRQGIAELGQGWPV